MRQPLMPAGTGGANRQSLYGSQDLSTRTENHGMGFGLRTTKVEAEDRFFFPLSRTNVLTPLQHSLICTVLCLSCCRHVCLAATRAIEGWAPWIWRMYGCEICLQQRSCWHPKPSIGTISICVRRS